MDPFSMGALALGGGAIAKTLGGYLQGQEESDSQRQGAGDYLKYISEQRNQFLDDPDSQEIKRKLGRYAAGDRGFAPHALQAMRAGVNEDYGKALSDMGPQVKQASVMPGAGYAPGRAARSQRLLGENLAVRRAEGNRAITTANENQAQNNFRYAVSAIPTFTQGSSLTTMAGPQTFQALNAPNFGPSMALGSIGDSLMRSYLMGGSGGRGFGGGPDLQSLFGWS